MRKICNCWFELGTMLKPIWGNGHLSCTFGLPRCHLAMMSGKARSDFDGEQSQAHFTLISAHCNHKKIPSYRFHCLTWGCNNLFVQVCIRIGRLWRKNTLKYFGEVAFNPLYAGYSIFFSGSELVGNIAQNGWKDISWNFRDMSDITQQTIGRAAYCFTVLKLGSVAFLLAILRKTDESTSMIFSR